MKLGVEVPAPRLVVPAARGRPRSTSTPSGRSPGRSPSRSRRLRRKRPAPIRSTSDPATCATTSASRAAKRRRPGGLEAAGRERLDRAGARGAQRRPQPEDDAGGDREQRARRAARRGRARARGRARPAAAAGRPGSARRPSAARPTPSAAAPHGEQQALGQELAHELAAPGAERHPDRDLAPPRARPRQQQARDVRAGEQQHQAHRREEHAEERGDRPANLGQDARGVLRQHADARGARREPVGPRVGVGSREAASHEREVGPRVLDRARPDAAGRSASGRGCRARRATPRRAPGASRAARRRPSRCRAAFPRSPRAPRPRSCTGRPLSAILRPTSGRVAAEAALPERVAQDRDGMLAGGLLGRQQRPSVGGRGARSRRRSCRSRAGPPRAGSRRHRTARAAGSRTPPGPRTTGSPSGSPGSRDRRTRRRAARCSRSCRPSRGARDRGRAAAGAAGRSAG